MRVDTIRLSGSPSFSFAEDEPPDTNENDSTYELNKEHFRIWKKIVQSCQAGKHDWIKIQKACKISMQVLLREIKLCPSGILDIRSDGIYLDDRVYNLSLKQIENKFKKMYNSM